MSAVGNLAGATVVVTGASSGTGAAAARLLHRLGARIVVVGRDPARTRAVADALDTPSHTVDFASLDDVRRLADELLAEYPRLDVLANNAGGAVSATAPTPDGHEPNYQLNALAPFLLTTLVDPALQAAGGRVVATSSGSHRGARLTAERVGAELDDPGRLGPHGRYARAKLAGLLLNREYRRRTPEVAVVDFHPGIVASDFGRYLGRPGQVLTALSRPVLTSPDTAGARLVRLAAADRAEVDGRYFHGTRLRRPSPLVADDRLARAVWDDARRRLARVR